ncbi:hypothetical protein C4K26_3342 [Pseudomonas chlororaphis]|nr:hypothetical protein C4K26_3342 [Pseudomonas chlororaphis]
MELLKIAPGYDIQRFFSGRLAIVWHFFDAGHFRLRFRQNASIQGHALAIEALDELRQAAPFRPLSRYICPYVFP